MTSLTNIAKSAAATLTNKPKNRQIAAVPGIIFYGWMFWFTYSIPATGPQLTNSAKHAASITNLPKH